MIITSIKFARSWSRGEVGLTQARMSAFDANAAARELSGAAREAAYAIRAVCGAAPKDKHDQAGRLECQWQRAQLPEKIRELVLDDEGLRNELCWFVFDC